MPRKDGSGPFGSGAMKGRGFGYCTGANAIKYCFKQTPTRSQKDLLNDQKKVLQGRLELIERQLEEL